jgi:NAD(P)-dependent dehydrogenase (short-subunit alcohol dehydrogenase family)
MSAHEQALHGRRVLITGANKGIGLAAAHQFGQRGATVLVGARDAARGQAAAAALAAAGYAADSVVLDVTDTHSLTRAAQEIDAGGGLDVLVNNAGLGLVTVAPSALSTEQLAEILNTNLYGTIRATQAMLPMLRRAAQGRIVNVSSAMGSIFKLADPEWEAYHVMLTPYSISKAALNAYTALLSAELAGTSIKVNAVEPGFTATELTGWRGSQTPEEAARVIVKYAAIGADGPTGGYFDWIGRMPW